jgi:hypothetical protein
MNILIYCTWLRRVSELEDISVETKQERNRKKYSSIQKWNRISKNYWPTMKF